MIPLNVERMKKKLIKQIDEKANKKNTFLI